MPVYYFRTAWRPGFDSRQEEWRDFFFFSTASRLALGRTQLLSGGY